MKGYNGANAILRSTLEGNHHQPDTQKLRHVSNSAVGRFNSLTTKPQRETKTGSLLLPASDNARRFCTGTYANHISLVYLAEKKEFEVNINKSPEYNFSWRMGRRFANTGRQEVEGAFICHFNVFRTLEIPDPIGMAFLSANETLTNQLKMLFVDFCCPYSRESDTGSEIARDNGHNAMRYNLGCEELILADGSLEYNSGYTHVEVKLLRRRNKPFLEWKWLGGERLDVLLEEDLIDRFQIFPQGAYALLFGPRFFIQSELSSLGGTYFLACGNLDLSNWQHGCFLETGVNQEYCERKTAIAWTLGLKSARRKDCFGEVFEYPFFISISRQAESARSSYSGKYADSMFSLKLHYLLVTHLPIGILLGAELPIAYSATFQRLHSRSVVDSDEQVLAFLFGSLDDIIRRLA
ncbi:uncharacterized protein BDR25DRAFT_356499 [Lindgomyces ingoldianus]|uniref:Uncharacterized protein n=1 Tax=Lindgomyces ingoldianus TaxID=673940 RepID=A0ACB6QQF9_9PLEO|nr:uncharacterized protein BDR25DRAFT_356499 [Lindgomyces ingoldianus]KAF2469249.1 hypothetical protein BDR25DRAFT_356499 [Lindgomyces ingoldianus]